MENQRSTQYIGWKWIRFCKLFGLGLFGLLLWRPAWSVEAHQTIWPIDLPTRYLTSNFMEYRPGRFHAGLDFKTQSQTGYIVRAVEDGWISRVRATPTAYGRAVYVQGRSGRTFVYAHLEQFADFIAQPVAKQQQSSGRYSVRRQFGPDVLPVEAGQILGFSGESGTLGPHLHFEIRDANQRPLNPLDQGFAVPDTLAPVIWRLRAVPATADALIQGQNVARIIDAGSEASIGLSGNLPPLQIQGPVAFSAKMVDASDIRGHRLEPWLIELKLDGRTVYSCQNDSYAFTENSLQRLEWLELPGIREHWLHRHPDNDLVGRDGGLWYLGRQGAGLSTGSHTLELRVSDHAGNLTRVVVPLLVSAGPTDAPSNTDWVAQITELRFARPAAMDSIRVTPFYSIPNESVPGLDMRRLDPTLGDPVLTPAQLWTVPSDLSAAQQRQATGQGLTLIDPGAEYVSAAWPIDAAVTVDLPVRDSTIGQDPQVAVYRWHKGKWKRVGRLLPPVKPGQSHRFALSDLGCHAVFRDHKPPLVPAQDQPLRVQPETRPSYPGLTRFRWQVLSVPVLEQGSGLDPALIAAQLNGQPVIVEPDLPRDRLLIQLPDDLAVGQHLLQLTVGDEAGLVTELDLVLEAR